MDKKKIFLVIIVLLWVVLLWRARSVALWFLLPLWLLWLLLLLRLLVFLFLFLSLVESADILVGQQVGIRLGRLPLFTVFMQ